MTIRKNAGRQIIDTIKKVTTKVGVVKGLYGDSFQPIDTSLLAQNAGWYFFKLSMDYLPSLSESYKKIVQDNISPEILPIGDNNKANLGSTVIGEDANNILILMAGVEVPRSLETSITVECENADILLYVNNYKIAEETGGIRNRRIFLSDAERNLIQIVIRRRKSGGTKVIYFKGHIQLDPTIPIIFTPMVPGTPEWTETGSILYGSLDGNPEHTGIILSWYDNPFAAGWNIERYSYSGLGVVYDSDTVGSWGSGTFRRVYSVSGVHAPSNVLAVWGDTLLGYITGYDLSGNNTIIQIEPEDDTSPIVADDSLFYEFTEASIVASVDRSHLTDLGEVVKYVDTSVIPGMPYSYRLAAKAIYDPSQTGPYGTLRTDNAYDDGPPGPIVLWPDEIDATSSVGPLVTVRHIYPPDEDLFGYKIYIASGGRSKESYTDGEKPRMLVDLRVGTDYMRLDFIPSGVDPGSLPERYGEFDFVAKEIKNVNATLIIDGYIATTYDFAGNERTIPDGTEFTVTFLVLPPENFTSFDNLVSPAFGHRKPDGVPEHMWLTALDLKLGQESSVESL